jgi:hypothetical protein
MKSRDTDKAPFRSLLRGLSSRNAKKREAALQEALRLTPEDRLTLLQRLLQHGDRLESWNTTALLLLIVACLSVCFGILTGSVSGVILAAALPIAAFPLGRMSSGQAHASLESLLLVRPDTRLLPHLLMASPSGSEFDTRRPRSRQAVRYNGMKILLPLLQPGEADAWTAWQRQNLAGYLKRALRDVDFTVCALEATERINDSQVAKEARSLSKIPRGSAVLNMPFSLRPDRYFRAVRRIEEAAQKCLPKDILLRASEAPSRTAPETLLRPAETAPGATPPEQLLRPQIRK